MGGGGTPAAPSTVSVPSAADEAAAEERARLYSLLRSKRGGYGLMYGPPRRSSLLDLTKAASAKTGMGALADLVPFLVEAGGGGGGEAGGGSGDGRSGSSTDSPGGRGDNDAGQGHGGSGMGMA